MRLRNAAAIGVLAAGLSLALFHSQAQAQDQGYRTIERSSAQDVAEGIANKAARGVTNIATGWMEIPKQIELTIKEDGIAKGVTVGTMKGLGMTVIRTLSGVAETATFFVAYPGFYDPYMEPAYVWQKE